MILTSLMESVERNELILVEGGICRFYQCKDKSFTIREILSIKPGAGTEMLNRMIAMNPPYISALVSQAWDANKWYEKKGFVLEREVEKKDRKLNRWVLYLTEDFSVSLSLF